MDDIDAKTLKFPTTGTDARLTEAGAVLVAKLSTSALAVTARTITCNGRQ